MKYYLITCQRGHCGSGHHTEITFAFKAANLLDAQDKARKMPSVKHTRGILYGREITEAEYKLYREKSAYERFNQNYYR